ncbi:hypothetical protein BDR03DRAFT_986921, partial [Suillus americanus]
NQSDPEVSASLKGPSSEDILKAIVRPAAIATAALRVIHPQQYWTGLQAFVSLGDKAGSKELPKMSETLQYWATVFNILTIICNWETPNHRDHSLIPECFDILTSVGNYSNARMSMPSLQLEFRKDCQTWGSCSGRGLNWLGMVYEGCCSYLCWDSVLWMGKARWEEVEMVVTRYRVSGVGFWESGLDIRGYSIVMFYTFHQLLTTEYRVLGVGFWESGLNM